MVADCPDTQPVNPLLTGQGLLESVITGPDDKLYFTDGDKKALVRLDRPGAQPITVAGDIDAPGGLINDGNAILVGYGTSILGGVLGNLLPAAGIVSVDLRTGEKTPVVAGTGMSNGLARDAGGTIYASSDVGIGIDKIVNGRVERQWASVLSANGLAVDSANRYLYANQTFVPAAVVRVDLTDPSDVVTVARPPFEDLGAGLDGLTIDQNDRLYAAVNLHGEVWRITPEDGSICAMARGLNRPSAVAFGNGGPFPFTSLYAVGFDGSVTEIPNAREDAVATPAPLIRVRVRVKPRRMRVGVRTTVTVRIIRGADPVSGVRVRLLKRVRGTTNAKGMVRFRFTPRRRGAVTLRASGQRVKLRVRRAGPVLRPQAPTG